IIKRRSLAHAVARNREITFLAWHLSLLIAPRSAQQVIFIGAFNDRELKIIAESRDVHPSKSFAELRAKLLTGILPSFIELLLSLLLQLSRFHICPIRFIKLKEQQHSAGCK